LEALTRSHLPRYYDEPSFPTEVCRGAARTKEQSQRRVRSLVTRMVSKEQPTDLEGQTRAQLIMARRADLHPKAEYICADSSSRPNLTLAVAADHTFSLVRPFCALPGRTRNCACHAHFCSASVAPLPLLPSSRLALNKCGQRDFSGYSVRKARIGSILVARHAGTHAAAMVITETVAIAIKIAVGSSGLNS
jgi:hypothetical protein